MGDDSRMRILTSKVWQPCDGPLLRAGLHLIGKALSRLSNSESGPVTQAERQESIETRDRGPIPQAECRMGMRGARDRDPRCTRILPLDISKGPRQEGPVV